jgi:hypothetical protein
MPAPAEREVGCNQPHGRAVSAVSGQRVGAFPSRFGLAAVTNIARVCVLTRAEDQGLPWGARVAKWRKGPEGSAYPLRGSKRYTVRGLRKIGRREQLRRRPPPSATRRLRSGKLDPARRPAVESEKAGGSFACLQSGTGSRSAASRRRDHLLEDSGRIVRGRGFVSSDRARRRPRAPRFVRT